MAQLYLVEQYVWQSLSLIIQRWRLFCLEIYRLESPECGTGGLPASYKDAGCLKYLYFHLAVKLDVLHSASDLELQSQIDRVLHKE